MALNAEWHRAHPMPKNATDQERLDWHLEHEKQCTCAPIPKGLLPLLKGRGGAAERSPPRAKARKPRE